MSRRDRLRGRGRPTARYPLPVDDVAAATRALRLAERAWQLAHLRTDEGGPAAVAAAREALDQAQQALQECYETIELTALAPEDYEQLVAQHPPREGSDDEEWDTEQFPVACFLACAPGDMGDQEWAEFLRRNVSWLERQELLQLAVAVNVRAVDPAVPKG
ncbi:hypothetical protein MF672_010885 [Actinomadura sp. ATCC 31491]|uniref:Uncharacterized protein n=1 Tax=Actinomadura luzonensis TaxID=2805427 RepID=A0ABT0FPQ0_9ACTN|nr:hypothetical protein [Actinomadura luzonensis]MCK2214292.1 hypothetical protein [Actinomadura luzonensis]